MPLRRSLGWERARYRKKIAVFFTDANLTYELDLMPQNTLQFNLVLLKRFLVIQLIRLDYWIQLLQIHNVIILFHRTLETSLFWDYVLSLSYKVLFWLQIGIRRLIIHTMVSEKVFGWLCYLLMDCRQAKILSTGSVKTRSYALQAVASNEIYFLRDLWFSCKCRIR